jgi:hypothetical protein
MENPCAIVHAEVQSETTVGLNRWKSVPPRLKRSRVDDNYGTAKAVPVAAEPLHKSRSLLRP